VSDIPAPVRKTRRERFVEVGTRRTKMVLKDIRRLANCANRSAYQYDEADVQKIFGAIERELQAARDRFNTKEERKEIDFSLK
jgi:hypothetical protein